MFCKKLSYLDLMSDLHFMAYDIQLMFFFLSHLFAILVSKVYSDPHH